MPAPRKTVLSILFNARIADTQSAGAGAALIQSLIAQQFSNVTQNMGRITVSVSGGGKSYSFTAMKIEDIMGDALEAWQIWSSSTQAQINSLLDGPPIRRSQATFADFSTTNYQCPV